MIPIQSSGYEKDLNLSSVSWNVTTHHSFHDLNWGDGSIALRDNDIISWEPVIRRQLTMIFT